MFRVYESFGRGLSREKTASLTHWPRFASYLGFSAGGLHHIVVHCYFFQSSGRLVQLWN